MNVENFFEYAVHLENFESDQLDELLDYEEIEALPDAPIRQVAVEALGQFLMGNRQDPTETFESLDELDRRLFLDTWFSVIQDSQNLKMMGQFVVHRLMGFKNAI